MSGESPMMLRNRARLSPEHRALAEWLYEFTKDEIWRGSLLLGMIEKNATDSPNMTYWQQLAWAKVGLEQLITQREIATGHRLWHVISHQYLDHLISDFIHHNPRPLGSIKSPIEELMKWSYRQTVLPTEIHRG